MLADEAQAREAWLTERLEKLDPAGLATLRSAIDILSALVNDEN